MKLDVGILAQAPAGAADRARRAEALGFDGLWSSETQHDPFLPLAVAASVTSRIELGTAIALAFVRSPMVTAQIAWDLQALSNGRFILGLGTQVKAHNERRFSVKFDSPGPKLREAVRALRAIWGCWQNGTTLDFRGEFYTFDLMTPFFNPGPIEHPRIPIFTAGVNAYTCRVAGEVCDGIHVHPFHTPKYIRDHVRPAVEQGLTLSDRSAAGFIYATAAFVILGDTDEERALAREAVRQQIAFYASTRTYEPVLATHGWEGLTRDLHRKSVAGDWKGMAALVTDEMVDAFAVTGNYDTIATLLKERYEGLIDRVSLYQPQQSGVEDPRIARVVKAFRAADPPKAV